MSKATDKQPKVQEVADDEEAPDLMDNAEGDQIDADALNALAGGALGGKGTKRYAKAMAKLGLKQEAGIFKVVVKKAGQPTALTKTEVYRFPNSNTFVIFGEPAYDDAFLGGGSDATRAAAAVTGAAPPAAVAPAASAAAAAADDEEEIDAGDLGDKEIKLVMSQANVSRNRAIKALKNNKGDIVNTIMELTM